MSPLPSKQHIASANMWVWRNGLVFFGGPALDCDLPAFAMMKIAMSRRGRSRRYSNYIHDRG
jgi:hypothetical protein